MPQYKHKSEPLLLLWWSIAPRLATSSPTARGQQARVSSSTLATLIRRSDSEDGWMCIWMDGWSINLKGLGVVVKSRVLRGAVFFNPSCIHIPICVMLFQMGEPIWNTKQPKYITSHDICYSEAELHCICLQDGMYSVTEEFCPLLNMFCVGTVSFGILCIENREYNWVDH